MLPRNTVVVARGQILFPNLCPVCLSPGPSSRQSITSDYGKFSGYYVFFTTKKHLVTQIAICPNCLAKERRLQKYAGAFVIVGLLIAVAVAIGFDLGRGWVFALGYRVRAHQEFFCPS